MGNKIKITSFDSVDEKRRQQMEQEPAILAL